jgi:hypothetical protein
MTREAHLVGSVPLASSEEVFRAVTAAIGGHLRKIPDGETGERRSWINFQYAVLAAQPALEATGVTVAAGRFPEGGAAASYRYEPLRLRAGAKAEDLRFGALGYAAAARASYAVFSALKREGVIAPATRFQVSLPTPLAPMTVFVVPEDRVAVYAPYAAALLRELDEIAAAIPHDELAIQWDVSAEFAIWEGIFPPVPGDWLARIVEHGDRVPAGAWLGYHLCYGDRGHRHFVEPRDAGLLAETARRISAGLGRSLEWIHLPVPKNRDDDAYFAPLADLALRPETKLFLGLVHHTDGLEGARRRITAASRVLSGFGIATECGFGRRDPATVPALLRLHAEVAAA